MTFIYTQATFQERLNGKIQGKIGMLVSPQETMNDAVRQVNSDFDILSLKRRSVLSPNLFNGIFDYLCPTDLKGNAIVDLPAQAKRSDGEFNLVSPQHFDTTSNNGDIAIDSFNGTKVLKVRSVVDSQSIVVAELDSTVSGSNNSTPWTGFGDVTDADIVDDNADYVKGNGSIKFSINAAAGTTAGIKNASIASLDISDYLGGTSAFFVWAKINSTTNLTSYTLRFGSSGSNYYSKTVTAQADGTAFVSGWNLLKFDVSSLTETGTVTDTAITYFAIYMNKTIAKVSESDYKFDWLVLKKGVVTYVKYYSKYGWQTSPGSYIENSTATSDLLVADTDEYDLYIAKARHLAADELGFDEADIARYKKDYEDMLKNYKLNHPSESKVFTEEYYVY